ncbi:hypothetical protein [Christiangramia sp. LLG6405-1]|uniref:hypothetical protein n=1 Tax=Christiangramia sp. LLG6405-1 TaxID=3160832 RepID=UPI003870A3A5
MKNQELIKFGLISLIIDVIIIWFYVYKFEKPDPSVSIAAILIVPSLLIINLILGFILLVIKNKFSKIFFINSLLSPTIFYALWILWYNGYSSRYYIDYHFKSDNKLHELSLSKESDFFNISDISTQKNGFTTGLYSGKYDIVGDTILMIDDTIRMFIIDDKLIGFPNDFKTRFKLEEQ